MARSDDDIDSFDFLNWQRGLGDTFNGNDLTDWKENYGTVIIPVVMAAVTAVPEPTTGFMLLIGMVFLLPQKRQTKQSDLM
ncbi:MAG: PEP-CTERM sorting domain-containing protein [Pirellulales bacterium]